MNGNTKKLSRFFLSRKKLNTTWFYKWGSFINYSIHIWLWIENTLMVFLVRQKRTYKGRRTRRKLSPGYLGLEPKIVENWPNKGLYMELLRRYWQNIHILQWYFVNIFLEISYITYQISKTLFHMFINDIFHGNKLLVKRIRDTSAQHINSRVIQ